LETTLRIKVQITPLCQLLID